MMTAVLIVTGFLVGIKFGAEGVALGYSAAMCPATVIAWVYGLRGTSIKPGEVLRIFLLPLGTGIIASIVALVITGFLELMVNEFFAAGVGIAAFFLAYLFVLFFVFHRWPFFYGIIKAWKSNGGQVF
jgi:hypothetical protein